MEANRVSGSEELASGPCCPPKLLGGIGAHACTPQVLKTFGGYVVLGNMGQQWYDFPTRTIYQLAPATLRLKWPTPNRASCGVCISAQVWLHPEQLLIRTRPSPALSYWISIKPWESIAPMLQSRKLRRAEDKQRAQSHTPRKQVWLILKIVLLTTMVSSFILSLRFALGALECRYKWGCSGQRGWAGDISTAHGKAVE